jgi:predicted flap endonuclease-1-like 5' DNA nuclease
MAIDGVGPVTAQKLHDLGLYTYNDIRDAIPGPLEEQLGPHISQKLTRWLDQHLP